MNQDRELELRTVSDLSLHYFHLPKFPFPYTRVSVVTKRVQTKSPLNSALSGPCESGVFANSAPHPRRRAVRLIVVMMVPLCHGKSNPTRAPEFRQTRKFDWRYWIHR